MQIPQRKVLWQSSMLYISHLVVHVNHFLHKQKSCNLASSITQRPIKCVKKILGKMENEIRDNLFVPTEKKSHLFTPINFQGSRKLIWRREEKLCCFSFFFFFAFLAINWLKNLKTQAKKSLSPSDLPDGISIQNFD